MNLKPIEIYQRHREEFDKYIELLIKWNKKFNLTSIDSRDEIVELHFIDSLSLLPHLVSRETVLDIGSGAGFPGLPIKIACQELKVTLVDSMKKKCDFMKTVIREVGLDGISVVQKRVGENESIGEFDVVVSRATLKLEKLIRIAAPNLKPDGLLIAMKGVEVAQEIAEAEMALKVCGFLPVREVIYELPRSGKKRKLVVASISPSPESTVVIRPP